MARLTLIFSLFVVSGSSLNILIYNPIHATSHCYFFNRISDILVKGGHNVVQLSPIAKEGIRCGTTLAERITVPQDLSPYHEAVELEKKILDESWKVENALADPLLIVNLFRLMKFRLKTTCSLLLNNTVLLDDLRSRKFDIFFSELMDVCGFGISHAIGIPQTINCLSFVLQEDVAFNIGCPTAPSYVPSFASSGFSDKMSFWQRMANGGATAAMYFFSDWQSRGIDNLFQSKYGNDFPGIQEIIDNATFVFTNSNPYMDFPRPTLHKIIDIGGVAVPERSTEKLEKKWDRLLNLREKTILLSFGTVANCTLMPDAMKKSIQRALRSYPHVTFVWRYEKPEHNLGASLETATADADNIVVIEWMPQNQLLGDPRVVGFITHGGIGSINEGTTRGVPLVVIPIFGDQFRNAKMVERLGSAIIFDKMELVDTAKFSAAIRRLIEDRELHSTAQKIGSILENRPFTMAETLLKYTEFAATKGPFPQLVPYGKNLSLIQYFLIDVVVVVFLVFLIVILLACFILWKIFKCIRRNISNSEYSEVPKKQC